MFWKYFSFWEKVLQEKCPLEYKPKLGTLTNIPEEEVYMWKQTLLHVIFMISNILLQYLYLANFQIVYRWFFWFFYTKNFCLYVPLFILEDSSQLVSSFQRDTLIF